MHRAGLRCATRSGSWSIGLARAWLQSEQGPAAAPSRLGPVVTGCGGNSALPVLPACSRCACRAESHRHVLQAAARELLARIERMQPDRLLQLLEARGGAALGCSCGMAGGGSRGRLALQRHCNVPSAPASLHPWRTHGSRSLGGTHAAYCTPMQGPTQSAQVSFPYIGIADLRAIPLAVLDRLQVRALPWRARTERRGAARSSAAEAALAHAGPRPLPCPSPAAPPTRPIQPHPAPRRSRCPPHS